MTVPPIQEDKEEQDLTAQLAAALEGTAIPRATHALLDSQQKDSAIELRAAISRLQQVNLQQEMSMPAKQALRTQ